MASPHAEVAPPGPDLYDRWVVILTLFTCFPVGLFTLWRSPKFEKNDRIIITSLWGSLCLLTSIVVMLTPKPETPKVSSLPVSAPAAVTTTRAEGVAGCRAQGLEYVEKIDPITGSSQIQCVAATSTPTPTLTPTAGPAMSQAEAKLFFNELKAMEAQGRGLEGYRYEFEQLSQPGATDRAKQCMSGLHARQAQATEMRTRAERIPSPHGIYFSTAAIDLKLCVSCNKGLALKHCNLARESIEKASAELRGRW